MRLHELSQFRFADLDSRLNAQSAVAGELPAAFLIVGPAASGKTRLARLILERVIGYEPAASHSDLERALELGAITGFLFLDDIGDAALNDCRLAAYLSEPSDEVKPIHIKTQVVAAPRIAVIASNAAIPVELLQFVRVIRLALDAAPKEAL